MTTSFSSFSQERLAWCFKVQLQYKDLDEKTLYKYAVVFWNICIAKGEEDCPFPDALVKYYHENRFNNNF